MNTFIKKKVLIILSALCLAFIFAGVVGCGGNSGGNSEGGLPSVNPLDEVCTVVFVDDDGKYISHETVEKGESVFAPDYDSGYKKNYYFDGWSENLDNVTEDLVVKPVWKTNENIDGLKIYKDADKDFKTLLIADIQTVNTETSAGAALVATGNEKYAVYSDSAACVYDTVRALVNENSPDYIVLMGDNIYSRFDSNSLDAHRELMEIMDGFKIPWSIIFGNHDGDVPDTAITRAEIIEVYGESKYFLFEQEKGAECGDYVVNVVEKGSDEIFTQYVFMFTHANAGDVTAAQIKWYESKMEKLVGESGVIPSVMFAHIPFAELYDALVEKYDDKTVTDSNGKFSKLTVPENTDGDFGEANSFTYSAQHGLFNSVKRYGSTQAVFFGHNHSNDFSVEVDGVRLTHVVKCGFYDQAIANRYLNGGTLLTLDDNGSDYTVTHKFVNGEERDEKGGSYSFNKTPSLSLDNDYLFLDYKSSLGSMSGANKITLSEGESAYIEFDVITGLYTNSGSDNMQAGFRISANPITQSWPSGVCYTYFMATVANCPREEAGVIMTDGIIPETYAETGYTIGTKGKFNVEKVFRAGTTVRYTVYADGTYTMATKASGERESEYAVFRRGTVTIDISGGFYMGFTANRSIGIDNVVITGSDYVTGYNFAGFNAVIGGISADKYVASNSDLLSYVYSKEGKILENPTDCIQIEMTLVKPQTVIDAGRFCAFAVTETPTNNSPYTTDSGFMVNCNHCYVTFNSNPSKNVKGTLTGVENSHLDYTLRYEEDNLAWNGSMFFKSYITYKFVYYGDGTFECYLKSALDKTAEYEKVYVGTTTGVDMTRPLYVGFVFFGECEISDVVTNGVRDNVALGNCTLVQ